MKNKWILSKATSIYPLSTSQTKKKDQKKLRERNEDSWNIWLESMSSEMNLTSFTTTSTLSLGICTQRKTHLSQFQKMYYLNSPRRLNDQNTVLKNSKLPSTTQVERLSKRTAMTTRQYPLNLKKTNKCNPKSFPQCTKPYKTKPKTNRNCLPQSICRRRISCREETMRDC